MRSKYKAAPVYFCSRQNRQLTPNEIKIYKASGNKSDFTDVIRFESQHEYKVYLVLRNSYLFSEISPQYQVEILPPKDSACFPTGKRWQVDFLAKGQHKEPLMLVEAKGLITRDFPLILAMFENFNQELFSKLWLVFDRIPKHNQLVKNLLHRQNKPNIPRIVTLSQFQRLFTTGLLL